MNLHYEHIKRLKQRLPRVGRQANNSGTNPPQQPNRPQQPVTQAEIDFANSMNTVLGKMTGLQEKANSAMAALNTEASNLSTGLNVLVGIHETYNKEILDTIYQTTFLENENKNLNDSFHIASSAAQIMGMNLRKLSQTTGYGYEKLSEYAIGLEDLTGGMISAENMTGKLQQAMIAGQAYMQGNLKMTAEAASGYERFANQFGKTAIDLTESTKGFADKISAKTGIDALKTQHDILAGIGGLTEDIQMQFGRIPGNLELSVLKAKALGVTMAQINTTGEKLVDIESSVGDELQYQLLSGRRLIVDGNKSFTNEYRIAQLKGDGNKQLDLMNQMLQREGKHLKNNYLARKQMAQLLGMDEKTLSSMIQKQEVAQELGIKNVLKLKPEEFANEIKKLKDAAFKETDSKVKADRLKKIEQLEKADDTRTAHEAATEESLKQIAATINKIGTFKVSDVRSQVKAYKAEADAVKLSLANSEEVARFTGKLKNITNSLESIQKPTEEIASSIGILSSFTKLINNIRTQLKAYTFDADKLPLGSVRKTAKQDAVFYPNSNKSNSVSFAPNDSVVAFKPGGPVEQSSRRYMQEQIASAAENIKTNNITTNNQRIYKQITNSEYLRNNTNNNTASTSLSSIDLSKLANTITSAMQRNNQPTFDVNVLATSIGKSIAQEMSRVKIEAKVKTDTLFAATTLNGSKRI